MKNENSRRPQLVPTLSVMKCPSCRTREMVVIEIRVSGEPVKMHSCSHCDQRWWEGLDGMLSLRSVLSLAGSN